MTYFEFPYCKIADGAAVACTLDQIKQDNPNVSFPAVVSDETLAEYSVYLLNHDSQAEFDFVERGPIEERNGEWWQTYTGRDKTPEEQAEFLNNWRSFAQVTPRQARLELAKRGQLANIDTIIASLPADQQEIVQIEWEYAVSIERSSPWVIQLGSALGLDEVGLDELFKAASEL